MLPKREIKFKNIGGALNTYSLNMRNTRNWGLSDDKEKNQYQQKAITFYCLKLYFIQFKK